MVKITSTPQPTSPVVTDAEAAVTVEAKNVAATTGAAPTALVQARDALDTTSKSRTSATDTEMRPQREAGAGALQQVADLLLHRDFGSPAVVPALGPDMEKIAPNAAALAVDVPAMLQETYAKLPPDSAHAQAIRDLSAALGGLEQLAPKNYLEEQA